MWGMGRAGASPALPSPGRRGSAGGFCVGRARRGAGRSPFDGGGIFQQSGGWFFLLLLKNADAWKSKPFVET